WGWGLEGRREGLVSGGELALLRERDTSSCGHCSEKGATVSKAAPPIIPSIPSVFMIGLRLQRHIPRHKGTNGPFEMCLPPNDAPNPPNWRARPPARNHQTPCSRGPRRNLQFINYVGRTLIATTRVMGPRKWIRLSPS